MLDVNKELETFFRLLDDAPEASPSSEQPPPDGFKSSHNNAGGLLQLLSREGRGEKPAKTAVRGADARTGSVEYDKRGRRSASQVPATDWKPLWVIGLVAAATLLAGAAAVSLSADYSQVESRIKTRVARVIGLTVPEEPRLSLTTTPAGAHVFLDKELVGVSPFAGVRVPPGQHHLRIDKIGFVSVDSLVFVGGERSLSFQLAASDVDPRTSGGVLRGRSAAPNSDEDDVSGVFASADVASADSMASFDEAAKDSTGLGDRDGVRDATLTLRPVSSFPTGIDVVGLRSPATVMDGAPTTAAVHADETQEKEDSFKEIVRRGDELFAGGRHSEAIAAFEEASRIRPGVPSVVRKIGLARKAAELAELPSAVFGNHYGTATD